MIATPLPGRVRLRRNARAVRAWTTASTRAAGARSRRPRRTLRLPPRARPPCACLARAAAVHAGRPAGGRAPRRRRQPVAGTGHAMLGVTLAPVTGRSWPGCVAASRRATTSRRSRPRASGDRAGGEPRRPRAAGSLAERAYERLREDIIAVGLAPGHAAARGRADAPARRRAHAGARGAAAAARDGFVTIIPRRGTLVTEISITDLAAIYEVRKQLEVVGVAAGRRTGGAEDHAEAGHGADWTELAALRPATTTRRCWRSTGAFDRFVYRTTRTSSWPRRCDRYHNLSLRILHVAMRRYPPLTPRLDDVVHEQRGDAGRDPARATVTPPSGSPTRTSPRSSGRSGS